MALNTACECDSGSAKSRLRNTREGIPACEAKCKPGASPRELTTSRNSTGKVPSVLFAIKLRSVVPPPEIKTAIGMLLMERMVSPVQKKGAESWPNQRLGWDRLGRLFLRLADFFLQLVHELLELLFGLGICERHRFFLDLERFLIVP